MHFQVSYRDRLNFMRRYDGFMVLDDIKIGCCLPDIQYPGDSTLFGVF